MLFGCCGIKRCSNREARDLRVYFSAAKSLQCLALLIKFKQYLFTYADFVDFRRSCCGVIAMLRNIRTRLILTIQKICNRVSTRALHLSLERLRPENLAKSAEQKRENQPISRTRLREHIESISTNDCLVCGCLVLVGQSATLRTNPPRSPI